MRIPPEKYEIGYGRPPEETRWNKGQCGNPNRMRKRVPKQVVQMIDEFFAGPIDVVENNVSRRISRFEAIVLQLWTKAMAGNKRAMNVLLIYKVFAASRGDMGGLEVERIIIDPKKAPEDKHD